MRRALALALLPLALSSAAFATPEQPASVDSPHYGKMQPVVIPLIGPKGIEQIVAISIALEVVSDDNEDKVKSRAPRLADAYVEALYGALDRRVLMHDSIIDIEKVKQTLSQTTDKVLGEGIVKGVMLQSVSQRPI